MVILVGREQMTFDRKAGLMAETYPPVKWFGLALQALVVLANQQCVAASTKIAGDIDVSNEATMRRVLGYLVRADLVVAREGRDGGYRLRLAPNQITLKAVYDAMAFVDPMTQGWIDSTTDCPVGQMVKLKLQPIAASIEAVRGEILARYTVEDFLQK